MHLLLEFWVTCIHESGRGWQCRHVTGNFVQVPSGIASKSSLISGLNTADQITNKSSSNNGGTVTNDASSLSFGATMVEVSIGISVGLFAAALIIYPFGKKRTGLFAL